MDPILGHREQSSSYMSNKNIIMTFPFMSFNMVPHLPRLVGWGWRTTVSDTQPLCPLNIYLSGF